MVLIGLFEVRECSCFGGTHIEVFQNMGGKAQRDRGRERGAHASRGNAGNTQESPSTERHENRPKYQQQWSGGSRIFVFKLLMNRLCKSQEINALHPPTGVSDPGLSML